MRLFVESVLEPLALDEVWSVGQQMRGEPGFPHGAVRWVKREAMHLTLRFLGKRTKIDCPRLSVRWQNCRAAFDSTCDWSPLVRSVVVGRG